MDGLPRLEAKRGFLNRPRNFTLELTGDSVRQVHRLPPSPCYSLFHWRTGFVTSFHYFDKRHNLVIITTSFVIEHRLYAPKYFTKHRMENFHKSFIVMMGSPSLVKFDIQAFLLCKSRNCVFAIGVRSY